MLLLLLSLQLFHDARSQQKAILAYYAGPAEKLDMYDARQFTHIIYCFGHLKGNKLHLRGAGDTALIRKMVSMKGVNKDLKVLLSLGGWGGCETCSAVFNTEAGRKEFARSVKELMNFFNADGIDLDWEYPAIEGYPGHQFIPEDKQNFTSLVKELRNVLGRKSTITFAAGGFQKFLEEAVDWKEVMPYVDYVNLMTYDLVSGFATVTGHHTGLYSTPVQKESGDNCVQYLIRQGVDPGKLILGAAFYSRVWEGVENVNNGLHQPGKFKNSFGFDDFPVQLAPGTGYTVYWDDIAKAPYAYNAKEKLFATFDDKRSIEEKSGYVLKHKLGGIMFWHLGHDTPKDGLLETINKVLKH
jgi:chitinase